MKQTGVALISGGFILLTIGTALMIYAFQNAQAPPSSATRIAEDIQQSLFPSGIGMLFVIAGLLMLIACWWRNRPAAAGITFTRTDR